MFREQQIVRIIANIIRMPLNLHLHRGILLQELNKKCQQHFGFLRQTIVIGLVVYVTQIADLARENGQLQAENAELKKELARLGSALDASAVAAAG